MFLKSKAVYYSKTDIVMALVNPNNSINLNKQDVVGSTPLHYGNI
jgi:hypothetical protein